MEVNCDDSADVMKRRKEYRAVIIRDNRHDGGRRTGGGGRGEKGRAECKWTTTE